MENNIGKYEIRGQEIGKLVDEKQAAYGGIDRVHAAMKIFYPEGIPVEKLTDALLIVRILDKVNRISGGDKAAFGENPFADLAGYSLLGYCQNELFNDLQHHINHQEQKHKSEPEIFKIYRNTRNGQLYRVLGFAGEDVVYISETGELWKRPKNEWFGVNREGQIRFELATVILGKDVIPPKVREA